MEPPEEGEVPKALPLVVSWRRRADLSQPS
jgi:hypothetical protein